jgi:hypothetical protein
VLVDALSYGSDATHASGLPPIEAPGAGRSIRRVFADDGSLLRAELADTPSPGTLEANPAPEAGTAPRADQRERLDAAALAMPRFEEWMALAGLATLALLGTAAARARALLASAGG